MGKPLRWSIIVHGGAKSILARDEGANRAGCLAAVVAGAAILRSGGTALDAAEEAVRLLENDPVFNAGTGSVQNDQGEVEMDAAIMDGATLDIGAVAALQCIGNPIKVARALLREPEILLIGEGAHKFALKKGLAFASEPVAVANDAKHDTVGCVAIDVHGHCAAAVSTGGLSGTRPGRVGDSPLPGCGFYAQDGRGAVAMSGDGESIMRTMLAARIMHRLDLAEPVDAAANEVLTALQRVGGEAGAIVLDRHGFPGIAHNSEHFAVALASDTVDARAALNADELSDILG